MHSIDNKKNVALPKLIAFQGEKIQIKNEFCPNGYFNSEQYYKYFHLNVHFIEPLITFRVLVNKMNALQVCNKLFACLFSCNSKISPVCLSGMCSVMTVDCESFAYLQWSFFSHFVLLILFDPSNRAIGWALYSFDEKKDHTEMWDANRLHCMHFFYWHALCSMIPRTLLCILVLYSLLYFILLPLFFRNLTNLLLGKVFEPIELKISRVRVNSVSNKQTSTSTYTLMLTKCTFLLCVFFFHPLPAKWITPT